MKLVAMTVVRNEADRYLRPFLAHLLEFCDEVRILDDGSTDEWSQEAQWWPEVVEHEGRVKVLWQEESTFYVHEGRTRQRLLEWTMKAEPTHVLAIDADEFVANGHEVRGRLQPDGTASLVMQEVWKADEKLLSIRQDGGWKEHPVACIFHVPAGHWSDRQIRRHWRINDRALACGRIPIWSTVRGNRGGNPVVGDILHFGWANEADRDARYQRYVVHDGGAHHAGSHLESIMWPDERVTLSTRHWPEFQAKPEILARASRP